METSGQLDAHKRACAVVRAVEAVVADYVATRMEDMRCSRTAAEQARVVIHLEKMDKHLLPPQFLGAVKDAVRKLAKQRFVLLVASNLGEQSTKGPQAKLNELRDRTGSEAITKPGSQNVADIGKLQIHGAYQVVRRCLMTRWKECYPATCQQQIPNTRILRFSMAQKKRRKSPRLFSGLRRKPGLNLPVA